MAAGTCQPTDAQATNCQPAAIAALAPTVGAAAAAAYVQTNAPVIVTAMGTAGAQLAGYVKDLIVAKGAKYVTVVNLPDLSVTPYALAQSADTRALITTMVTTFNNQLQTGLADNVNVLVVDAYSVNRDQNTNPGPYGLTNVTTPACDLSPAKNPLGSSLVCSAANVVAGDVSHYAYADSVHPTPFAYLLLARYVSEKMAVKGWL
jgi:phospholipase/lecithinase/hemolysin